MLAIQEHFSPYLIDFCITMFSQLGVRLAPVSFYLNRYTLPFPQRHQLVCSVVHWIHLLVYCLIILKLWCFWMQVKISWMT